MTVVRLTGKLVYGSTGTASGDTVLYNMTVVLARVGFVGCDDAVMVSLRIGYVPLPLRMEDGLCISATEDGLSATKDGV